MPSNHARIDADLVQKTQYKIPQNKTAKNPPPRSLGHSLNFVFLSTATGSY